MIMFVILGAQFKYHVIDTPRPHFHSQGGRGGARGAASAHTVLEQPLTGISISEICTSGTCILHSSIQGPVSRHPNLKPSTTVHLPSNKKELGKFIRIIIIIGKRPFEINKLSFL